MTALLEYLDLLQCLKITVLGHVHLSACNINNSPHKLGFQFSMRAGDQKLRFDLVWPNYKLEWPYILPSMPTSEYCSSPPLTFCVSAGKSNHVYACARNNNLIFAVCFSLHRICRVGKPIYRVNHSVTN